VKARNCGTEYVSKNVGFTAPCMSATIAWNDFLQTSGKWPASLTIPPAWPPMPRAQVLHAFLERMAFQNFHRPPASRAFLNVYKTARNPPPVVTFPKNLPMKDLLHEIGDRRPPTCLNPNSR